MIFPQCGSDGRTYSNTCMLNCAKQRYCWSLKMILLSKIWRCAEMTRGLTARAGPCSPNPLLNAVKQAGNKKILFSQRNSIISSVKSVSLKKKSQQMAIHGILATSWSPLRSWKRSASTAAVLGSRIPRWNLASFASLGILDPCSRIKDSQVGLCLFRFFGDPRSLFQDQRFLGGSLLTLKLLLSVWFRRANISKQMSPRLR